MKHYLLPISLFLQVSLFAQSPTLTLDYYFQIGDLHEYSYYNFNNTILETEGANVVWDFSDGQLGRLSAYTFSYKLDTIIRANGSILLPTGTYSDSGLESANGVLTKTIVPGYIQHEVLAIDNSAVSLLSNSFIDCDAIGGLNANTLKPSRIFPTAFTFQETATDTIHSIIGWFEKDTIRNTHTFIYSGYGSFIHPNGDTFCDVIQIKKIVQYPNQPPVETVTWYSQDTNSPLATYTKNNADTTGSHQVELKKINFSSIGINDWEGDTLKFSHTTSNCGFTLNLFPFNTCEFASNEIEIEIDFWNDRSIDARTSQKYVEHAQTAFPIGIHRISFQNPFSKEVGEQIIVIEDKNPPVIISGSCDGSGTYLTIPEDSSSILITPDHLSHTTDNDCNGELTFRFWLDPMKEMGIPNPDSLSVTQILSELPNTYRLNCFPEEIKSYWGWIYAFDQAGNWSRSSVSLTVFSDNCTYLCPTETFTKLSIKDINENALNQVISYEYGKEMDRQNDLYLYRVCELDTTTTFALHKTSSVIENVTSFDLSLIQQHILGIKPFTSFYQFAAADVNYSGDITAFDLLTIKRTILGLNQFFNGGRSWVFFEQEDGLLDKHPNREVMPLHLLEEKNFPLLDTTYHFLGIKLGDVNAN